MVIAILRCEDRNALNILIGDVTNYMMDYFRKDFLHFGKKLLIIFQTGSYFHSFPLKSYRGLATWVDFLIFSEILGGFHFWWKKWAGHF